MFDEEEINSPTLLVPWSNLNEVQASDKPEEQISGAPGMKVDEDMQYSVVCSEHRRGHQNNEQKDKGAVTMEDFKYPSAPGGGLMASASTGQDDSPDAATKGGEAHHSNLTEERRSRTPERVVPGAVRMPGLNNIEGNEDDVLTVTTRDEEQGYVVTHEGTIGEISAEAELVNFDEEAKRVQDQVSQAIQRELQVAAVAGPPKNRYAMEIGGCLLAPDSDCRYSCVGHQARVRSRANSTANSECVTVR